jgi:hypothetical protein
MHAPVCRVACWPVSTHAVFSQTDRVRFERLRGPVWSNFMPYEADGRYNRVFDLADEGQEGSPLVHALPVSCGATHTFTRTTPMRGLIHADARTHTVSDMALMQVPHRMHNVPSRRLHTVGVSTLGIPAHAHGSFRNEKMSAVCAPRVIMSIDSTRAPIPPAALGSKARKSPGVLRGSLGLHPKARKSPGMFRGSLGLQAVICFHLVFRFMRNSSPSCKFGNHTCLHSLLPPPSPSRASALFPLKCKHTSLQIREGRSPHTCVCIDAYTYTCKNQK